MKRGSKVIPSMRGLLSRTSRDDMFNEAELCESSEDSLALSEANSY